VTFPPFPLFFDWCQMFSFRASYALSFASIDLAIFFSLTFYLSFFDKCFPLTSGRRQIARCVFSRAVRPFNGPFFLPPPFKLSAPDFRWFLSQPHFLRSFFSPGPPPFFAPDICFRRVRRRRDTPLGLAPQPLRAPKGLPDFEGTLSLFVLPPIQGTIGQTGPRQFFPPPLPGVIMFDL